MQYLQICREKGLRRRTRGREQSGIAWAGGEGERERWGRGQRERVGEERDGRMGRH